MPKKDEFVKFENSGRKIKSTFMIYANFEGILVPKGKRKQNPNDSYTKKCQKHVACSYGYRFVCVNDKFSKLFKSYIGENVIYNFVSSMMTKVNIVVV